VKTPGESDQEPQQAVLIEAVRRARTGKPTGSLERVSDEQLQQFKPAELRAAFDEVLTSRHADIGLEALRTSGILRVALPEVDQLAGLGDYKERHKDVWQHTKQVVIQTIPRLHLRWAALLHDIGKAKTRGLTDEGKVHFHGHPEVGARMFKRMVRRKSWFVRDRGLEKQVHFLILHHQRTAHYEASWTDSAVRRFAREMGPQLDDIFALARADMTTKHKKRKRRMLFQIKSFRDRITLLARLDAVVPALPKGLGNEIMSAFGLPPSKRIGDLLNALEQAVVENKVADQQEARVYVEYLNQNATEFELRGE